MKRILPWVPVVLGVVWLLWGMMPPKQPAGEMKIHEFGKIPIVYNGRVKPADTFARNILRIVSERETFVDGDGKRQPAIRWLLDMMTQFNNPDAKATRHEVFRIVNLDLQQSLGLERKPRYRYSVAEFGPKIQDLESEFRKANERREKKQPLDAFDAHLLMLQRNLNYYVGLSQLEAPHLIPPVGEDGHWETFMGALRHGGHENDPRVQNWRDLLNAYATGKVKEFNEEVARLLAWYEKERPADVTRSSFESFFNRLDPFLMCKVWYVVAFLVGLLAFIFICISGFSAGDPVRKASMYLIWFTFALHTLALLTRIYLSGRPPVTNLYSSAVFIGWGCVGLGLVLELIFRLGIGNIVSSIAGFGGLLIAHFLAADGDTMEVLQAVLDTQFWLATHVTCITLGYSTTYIAGLLGILFIFVGVFTPVLTAEMRRILAKMIYGVVCFATLFSFVGTVLGGLWADDSWGRFWGWDPKENGALIIVLWNAIILHARWGGLVRERGLALLAVFGNIVVTWSWFGVNQLGVGLHSYGFTEGTTLTIIVFVLSQVGVMIVGLIPEKNWISPAGSKGAHAESR